MERVIFLAHRFELTGGVSIAVADALFDKPFSVIGTRAGQVEIFWHEVNSRQPSGLGRLSDVEVPLSRGTSSTHGEEE